MHRRSLAERVGLPQATQIRIDVLRSPLGQKRIAAQQAKILKQSASLRVSLAGKRRRSPHPQHELPGLTDESGDSAKM
jgi:hypothetical protein